MRTYAPSLSSLWDYLILRACSRAVRVTAERMMGERGRTTVVIGAKTRTSYWYAHARDAGAAEEDYLRTAGRVVGNRERPARTTRGARFESNIDRATRPRCKARTA